MLGSTGIGFGKQPSHKLSPLLPSEHGRLLIDPDDKRMLVALENPIPAHTPSSRLSLSTRGNSPSREYPRKASARSCHYPPSTTLAPPATGYRAVCFKSFCTARCDQEFFWSVHAFLGSGLLSRFFLVNSLCRESPAIRLFHKLEDSEDGA